MLYSVINTIFYVYSMLIIIRVLLSWLPHDPNGAVVRYVYDFTEPYIGLFRRIFPPRPSFPIDISPLFALIVLHVAQALIIRLISIF